MNRSDAENYHGLMAESYDLFRGDDSVEEAPWFGFYRRRLEERPGLALELGCGTGRILLPFLQAGFAMEGVDSSPEMLAICREKAARRGLHPILYEQYMQDLDLPQRYTTLLIPLGSFILIGGHDDAREALRRFHAHLVPGGQLVFSTPAPYGGFYAPGPGSEWGEPHSVTRRSDGATVTLRQKGTVDRLEQTHHLQQRYELHKDRKLLRQEEHSEVVRSYGKHEVRLMLEAAGFENVRVFGNHTEEEATSEHESLVYWAKKKKGETPLAH